MTTTQKKLPGAVSWVDLMTSDIADARKFYGKLFGWEVEQGGPETGGYGMATLRGNRIAGMMQKTPDMQQMPTAWTVYFATDDADRTCAAIREFGGQVTIEPMDVMEEGRMAVASEPTGGVFGLWQAKKHGGMDLVDQPGSFAWTELNTRDMKRSSDFLVKVFGYQTRKMEGMEYTVLKLGDQDVGGVMQMTEQHFPPEVPPHWVVYFATADTDAATRQATEMGGKVMAPPFDSPYGRIAVLQDPQGGVFCVVKLPSRS